MSKKLSQLTQDGGFGWPVGMGERVKSSCSTPLEYLRAKFPLRNITMDEMKVIDVKGSKTEPDIVLAYAYSELIKEYHKGAEQTVKDYHVRVLLPFNAFAGIVSGSFEEIVLNAFQGHGECEIMGGFQIEHPNFAVVIGFVHDIDRQNAVGTGVVVNGQRVFPQNHN